VVVLTADHGVTPLPERTRAKTGGVAYRVFLDTLFTAVNRELDSLAGAGQPPRQWLEFDSGMLFLHDNGRFAATGIKTDSILAALSARILRVQGVARVIKPSDLANADTASDPIARRWLHSLTPDAGVVLTVTPQPGSVWDIANLPIAMHGLPTDDDAQVPIILWGRGVRRGAYAGRMNTVDIAPTLSVLLGITPLSLVDGRARTEALLPRN
jgi:arylsulfatase A-like enzyme